MALFWEEAFCEIEFWWKNVLLIWLVRQKNVLSRGEGIWVWLEFKKKTR